VALFGEGHHGEGSCVHGHGDGVNISARPWTVHTGDCRDALAAMDAESIDACVTDTPYGLSTILDPANLDREALWQRINTGEAELPIVRLLRSWLDTGENPIVKGRGFMGKEWDALVPAPNTWRALWRVMKPGAYLFAFAGTRTHDLITMSIRLAAFEVDDQICTWLQGQGMAKRVRLSLKIDEHHEATDDRLIRRAEAKRTKTSIPPPRHISSARFAGHDRQLGPKWEPIVVAAKPLRGTIAETALAFGTGGLNVDGCRIPRGDAGQQIATQGIRRPGRAMYGEGLGDAPGPITIHKRGGYPANVIIDEHVAAEINLQSGFLHPAGNLNTDRAMFKDAKPHVGLPNNVHGHVQHYDSGGGASRFFYTAKASTSERDKGLEDLPTLTPGERSGGREEGSAGINGYAGTRGEDGRNPGPCVKPLSLMRYLVRLASPPGAHDPDISKRPVVLDIFAGSGSTLVAGIIEGVRVIGCELDPQMADVATRRCRHAYALPPETAEEAAPVARVGGQVKMF
jgi:DNA modification methylase